MNRRMIALALALSAGCSKPAPPETAAPPEAPPTTQPAKSEAKLEAMREAVAAGRGASAVEHLHDADVNVRRGAILAAGPDAAVGAEELFGSLHDSDAEVRDLAAGALRSRGLSLNQVSFARQFSHPDPAERLAILNDLAAGGIPNPGPWLVRLGEDPVPAVRLGAARVATELGLKAPWIEEIASRDPDPAVREWAAFYHSRAGDVARVGHSD